MKAKSILVMVAMVVCFYLPKANATVYYHDGGTHNINQPINDSVYILDTFEGDPTTVNLVAGGSVTQLVPKGNSQVTVSGGSIGSGLYASDYSHVTFSGGSIGDKLRASGNSQVTVSGGSMNYMEVQENGQVTMTEGVITWNLSHRSSKQLNILGGSIGNQLFLAGGPVTIGGGYIDHLTTYTEVTIFDGTIDTIEDEGGSTITITGGDIGGVIKIGIHQNGSVLRVGGNNFQIDGSPVAYGTYVNTGEHFSNEKYYTDYILTGTLLNGDPINNTIEVYNNAIIVLSADPNTFVTIFDSNTTISNGNDYNTVVVKGDGTVVDMTGGNVNKLITMNESTFNMSGGNIAFNTYSYGSSVLNLSGGYVHNLDIFGSSVTTISDNFTVDGRLYNYGTLNITGGVCSIDYYGGVGKINISGGTIIDAHPDAPPYFGYYDGGIAIFGYDLSAVPYGGSYGYGQISGYLNDDTAFTINLGEREYAYITVHEGVMPPECTNKPESDLSGDCKVNFIDLSKMASEWLYDGTK